ncbi:MAG: regulatory protein RecX [Bacillota bacterium]|nr:regulatory protein RecX [Bacillota bacterium]
MPARRSRSGTGERENLEPPDGADLGPNPLDPAQASREAMTRALRLLSARPQTERELTDKLSRAGFGTGTIEGVLVRLRELRYVDDAAFAHQWVEERSRLRPIGRRALASELVRKGIAPEHIETALAIYDQGAELAAAQALAARANARYAGLSADARQRKCYAYLVGRGFEHEVARAAACSGGPGRPEN